MWHNHTMEYYSAMNIWIITHGTTKMNLEKNIILNEKKHTQKDSVNSIIQLHFYEVPRNGQIHGDRK